MSALGGYAASLRRSAALALCLVSSSMSSSVSLTFAQPKPVSEAPDEGRAQPLNLDGVGGLGFVQTLSGVEGLSLYRGLTPLLFSELTLGGSVIQREGRDSEYLFGGALALHFQLYQAGRRAALSVGARYQLSAGTLCLGELDPCQAGAISPSDVFEQSLDLPLRVWWFISPYLSLHSEFGLSLQLGSGSDPVTGDAPRDGYQLDAFRNRAPFGRLGLTIWL